MYSEMKPADTKGLSWNLTQDRKGHICTSGLDWFDCYIWMCVKHLRPVFKSVFMKERWVWK